MTMARYSLNTYDPETDEIINTFTSRGLQWGALVDIFEKIDDADDAQSQIGLYEDIMLLIFKKATREDLRFAYIEDMISVTQQVLSLGVKNGLLVQGKKAKGQKVKN